MNRKTRAWSFGLSHQRSDVEQFTWQSPSQANLLRRVRKCGCIPCYLRLFPASSVPRRVNSWPPVVAEACMVIVLWTMLASALTSTSLVSAVGRAGGILVTGVRVRGIAAANDAIERSVALRLRRCCTAACRHWCLIPRPSAMLRRRGLSRRFAATYAMAGFRSNGCSGDID